MAQFDVYRNPNSASRTRIPYLLDVQSDLLETLMTRVVVPLAKPDVMRGAVVERLTPVFTVDGKPVMMLTPELASIPRKAIGERIGTLAIHRNEIVAAIDFVLTGI